MSSQGGLSVLLLTTVLSLLPTPKHLSLLCSSGSRGYEALKEKLQSKGKNKQKGSADNNNKAAVMGSPSTSNDILVLESSDLRTVSATSPSPACSLVYMLPQPSSGHHRAPEYKDHVLVPPSVGCITIYYYYSPSGYKNDDEVAIPKALLKGCSQLQSVDLWPLSSSHFTTIMRMFLCGCTGLKEVDLSPLSTVTTIEGTFLYECTGLKKIDLSPLSKVKDVGGFFLWGCASLTKINLSPLSNLTTIHHSFLEGCTGLTTIDLTPFSKVTVVKDNFLAGCTGLEAIDVSPLLNLVYLSHGFLARCSGLKDLLDLSSLSKVKGVVTPFLEGCSGLKMVTPPPNCKNCPGGEWEVTGKGQWKKNSKKDSGCTCM